DAPHRPRRRLPGGARGDAPAAPRRTARRPALPGDGAEGQGRPGRAARAPRLPGRAALEGRDRRLARRAARHATRAHVVGAADVRSRVARAERWSLGGRAPARRRGRPGGRVRTLAPVGHGPNGGAWAFGRGHGFRASPVPRLEPWEEAAGLMLRRYLEAFGPATLADFARFTLLTREMVREAVAAAGDGLVRYRGPGGAELHDGPGAPLPGEDVPAPARLLPMWDSLHLAHEAPGRALSAAHRPAVVKRNGDVLPTLLLDGYVAGVWRPVPGGVEVTTFRRLTRSEWDEVAAEAA